MTTRIPATLFSGYLGSGKTTIISSVVDQLRQQNIKVVYIKNELGDDTIDTTLIKRKHILTKELLNGCICCTLVGSFHAALTEIAETINPDRIIIEGSGASDPAAIALTLDAHPAVCRDGVVVIIDVVNYEGIQLTAKSARPHFEFTDLIVFNKVELVDLAQKQRVVGYVREVLATAPIIEAPQGYVPADLVFGIHPHDVATKHVGTMQLLDIHSHVAAHDDHLNTEHIETWSVVFSRAVDMEKLVKLLATLPRELFRVKGYVANSQGQWWLLNVVNRDIRRTPAPSDFRPKQGKLVCLGQHIAPLRAQYQPFLEQCQV